MDDLSPLTSSWPVDSAAVGVTSTTETLGFGGDASWAPRVASISKLLTGYAGLIACEEGTIDLDAPAGPPGSTVRHLLAHTAGYGFDDATQNAPVGTRRIYSNVGIEVFADHLGEQAQMPFADYLAAAVFAPLGMTSSQLAGSPAHGVHTSVNDLLLFCRELLAPTLIAQETLAHATTVQFADVAGVLPSVGRFDPNPWGLTFEIRSTKSPHWTGTQNSPETFGHFGGTGTFLWVDPIAGLAAVGLADQNFGPWSLASWPPFSDTVLARYAPNGRGW